jgi:lipoprotein-releasing system ATP-binding protein
MNREETENLVLKRIKKTYVSGDKKITILNGLDLEVEAGDMVAIKGESGVGKTTLLHIIGSIETADSGAVIFGGKQINRLNGGRLDDFRNRKVGFIFQFFHLLPEFTALENVMMPLFIAGYSKPEARGKAMRLLTRVGLKKRAEHFPAKMSGGEQQRVAAARALAVSPRLLLADEPTGNLDPRTGIEVFNLLKDLHGEQKRITIVATHNSEIAEMCDKIYTLRKGKLNNQAD